MEDANEDELIQLSLARRDLRILSMAILEVQTEGFMFDWEYPIRLGGDKEYVESLRVRLSSLRHH